MWVDDVMGVGRLVQGYGFYGAQPSHKIKTHTQNRQTHFTRGTGHHNSIQASCWAWKWHAPYIGASHTGPLGLDMSESWLVTPVGNTR
jgi:hypothetical protein